MLMRCDDCGAIVVCSLGHDDCPGPVKSDGDALWRLLDEYRWSDIPVRDAMRYVEEEFRNRALAARVGGATTEGTTPDAGGKHAP